MWLRRMLIGAALGLCWVGTATAASTTVPGDTIPIDTIPVDAAPADSVPDSVPDEGGSSATPSTIAIDPSTGLPAAVGPLVVLAAGCVTPEAPAVVFEGTVVAAVADRARFSVGRVLSGSLEGHQTAQGVDVKYGDETRFLSVGSTYIVGAGVSPIDEQLVSTVREPAPLFGGDAVVGADDTDVDCITLDDPIRTLLPDGEQVDTGVLAPLDGHGSSLLMAVIKAVAWTSGALLALVVLKHLVFAAGRAVRRQIELRG